MACLGGNLDMLNKQPDFEPEITNTNDSDSAGLDTDDESSKYMGIPQKKKSGQVKNAIIIGCS